MSFQNCVQQSHSINANATSFGSKRQGSGSSVGQSSKSDINISQSTSASSSADEVEEINTKELAQRISAELKRYSIPQAIFAQRVLCRSQGTLSDLLRNPKPWSKLKSGRETFRRMYKWLEEPEFQRMSALRLAGKLNIYLYNVYLYTPTHKSHQAHRKPSSIVIQLNYFYLLILFCYHFVFGCPLFYFILFCFC